MNRFLLRSIGMLASVVLTLTAAAVAPASAAPLLGEITITAERVWIGPTGPDGGVPEAGDADANLIGYDAELWATLWKCSYAGWQPGKSVSWRCELRVGLYGAAVSTKTGSFSGGYANPGPWYYFGFGDCVYAEAHYNSHPQVSEYRIRCA